MLIEIRDLPSKRPKRWAVRKLYILRCDHCSEQFERSYTNQKVLTSKHFCTRACKHFAQQSGGIIAATVQNPWSRGDVKEKIKRTNLERYGCANVMQSTDVLSKVMRTRRHASKRFHWKTRQELICVGSYEAAFVIWCAMHQIDFDWQIAHRMPDGRTYIVDAFIKDGTYAKTWIEIKGWMTAVSRGK